MKIKYVTFDKFIDNHIPLLCFYCFVKTVTKEFYEILLFLEVISMIHVNMNISKLELFLNRIGASRNNYLNKILVTQTTYSCRQFVTTTLLQADESNPGNKKEESIRMKQFHKKLKLQPIPRVPPGERFVDLVLVETDPLNGEVITDSEKDPTKWGDWQNGGRVTDF